MIQLSILRQNIELQEGYSSHRKPYFEIDNSSIIEHDLPSAIGKFPNNGRLYLLKTFRLTDVLSSTLACSLDVMRQLKVVSRLLSAAEIVKTVV